MADPLHLLLALELFNDSEVNTNNVLSEDDDIIFSSAASCYMECANILRIQFQRILQTNSKATSA